MEEAFKAQTASGEPIVMLRDYTTGSPFNSGTINRTVDLNGYTWTCTGTDTNSAAEALYAPDRPVLGVQWHPERQSFALRREDAADGAPVFRWFRDALTNGGASLYNGD